MTDVLVAGFISIDFIAHVEGVAAPGAPEHATSMDVACGGRAANQAMALTAVESDVRLIARLGTDEHATILTEELLDMGINIDTVQQAPSPTGVRLISELADGTQSITIHRAANDYLTVDDMNRQAAAFSAAKAVGITTEPAGAVTLRALELARQGKTPSVLTHSANKKPVSDGVIAAADVIVTSASTCLGLLDPGMAESQPEAALRALMQRGAKAAVLLTGKRALLAVEGDVREAKSPGHLDSEDAVDAFVAGMLQGLSEGDAIEACVLRGIRISCLLID